MHDPTVGKTRVDEFEELRPHLLAVAYRLTGHLRRRRGRRAGRLAAVGRARRRRITDLRAWLTTVVSRLGLDRLRSAAHRRETYSANGCPSPS